MWRIKMFFKFILWLLKKAMWGPILLLAHLHMFIDEWKEQCREEFGLALLYYVLTTLCSMVGGIVGVLIMNGEDNTTKQMLTGSMASSFYFATGIFIAVILLASYDKFLEEYEQSFTKLKE